MTLEELRKHYEQMSANEKRNFVRELSSPLRKLIIAATQRGRTWVDDLSEAQKEEIKEAVTEGIAAGRIHLPDDGEGDFVNIDENIARQKPAIAQAYQVATGLQLPQDLELKLLAAASTEDLQAVFTEMIESDSGADRIMRAYSQILNGEIRARGEDEEILTPIRGNPNKMLNEAGEVVDAPLTARAGSDSTAAGGAGDIPPISEEEDLPTFIGGTPAGFEAGIGVDPTDEERQRALERAAQVNRAKYQDTKVEHGTLIQGLDAFDPNAPQFKVEQRYYEGEEWGLTWKSATYIRLIQEQLEAGGLLTPGSYPPGLWTTKSVQSMRTLMLEANATGKTWEHMLSDRKAAMTPEQLADIYGTSSSSRRAPFVAPTYRAPDHASLSQAVKGLVRQRLKREPTARDMAELTGQMDSDYKKEYDAEVAALRGEYNATSRAIDSDTSQSGGTVRMVDPSSRFAESFEQRFSGEISLNNDSDDFIETTAKAQGAMSRLDAMIGF